MGVVKNVDFDKFPQQSVFLGKGIRACFSYDISHAVNGTIVRMDIEAPYVTILKLDDGRFVLSTECQYTVVEWREDMTKLKEIY
jgi:hypothetical protein